MLRKRPQVKSGSAKSVLARIEKFSLRFLIAFVILPIIGFGTIPSGELCLVLLNFRLTLWICTEELENDACD